MTSETKPTGMLNKDFLLILLITFLYGLNMNLVNPIISQYAVTLGARGTILGLAVGLFSITALVVRPITGPLANNYDRKSMLLLAFVTYIAASFGYMMFEDIYFLLFFRFVHGFGLSLCSTLLPTLACEFVPENRIGAAIGYFSMCQTVAMALAPYIGISVSERYGYNSTFILTGIVAAVAFATVLLLKKQPVEGRGKRVKFSFSDVIAKETVLPSLLHMLGAMAYSLISSFVVIYAVSDRGVSAETIGWNFTTYAIVLVAVRPILAALVDRVKDIYFIIVCSLLSATGMLSFSLSTTLSSFILSSVLMALGFGTLMAVLQALCIKLVPIDSRGTANSTFNAGMDIGMGFGPVIGGAVAAVSSYSTMFMVFAINEVVVILLTVIFRSKLEYVKGE